MSIANATTRSSDMLKLIKSEQGEAASNLAVAGFMGNASSHVRRESYLPAMQPSMTLENKLF